MRITVTFYENDNKKGFKETMDFFEPTKDKLETAKRELDLKWARIHINQQKTPA